MRLLAIALITFGVALASAASAADLKPTFKAPPLQVPQHNWSGLYAGVSGGGAWTETAWSNATFGQYSGTNAGSGGIFGLTGGWNWQSGDLVLGLEGDVSWANVTATITNCLPTCNTQLRWFDTARGRIGTTFIAPNVLVYGTAGAAFADNQHTVTVTPASIVQANQTGWVAGVGVEGRIAGNWSAKLEYLSARFDSHLSCPAGPCIVNNFADFVRVNVVRAGINYLFF